MFNSLVRLPQKLICALLGFFLVMGVADTAKPHDVLDSQNSRLVFSVLSDVHMEGNNKPTRQRFIQTLYDIKNTDGGSDALVFLGDNLMTGQHLENAFFSGIINQVKPVPMNRVFTVMGNHELGYDKVVGSPESVSARFWSYYNAMTGRNVKAPYYYKETVEGYSFVFLNTNLEGEEETQQNRWLDRMLTEADGNSEVTFVFGHVPFFMSGTRDILKAHRNVVYFSGHTHTNYMSVYRLDSDSYAVNIPKCVDEPELDYDETGAGLQVEVYEGRVVLRLRRFYASEWIDETVLNMNSAAWDSPFFTK